MEKAKILHGYIPFKEIMKNYGLVEEKTLPFLMILNNYYGIETASSCEGHLDGKTPFIKFKIMNDDFQYFSSALMNDLSLIDSKYNIPRKTGTFEFESIIFEIDNSISHLLVTASSRKRADNESGLNDALEDFCEKVLSKTEEYLLLKKSKKLNNKIFRDYYKS